MRSVVLLVLLVSASCRTHTSEVIDQFVGTWALQRIEALDETGRWAPVTDDFGIDPMGYLMYDSSGHMSVQLMRRVRPRFKSDEIDEVTVDELRANCGNQRLRPCLGYGGYFGTFDVDPAEGSVTHHRLGHITPNQVGTDAKRFYRFEGSSLTLMPSRELRLIWKKLR